MRDYESRDLAGAAYLARDDYEPERPSADELAPDGGVRPGIPVPVTREDFLPAPLRRNQPQGDPHV